MSNPIEIKFPEKNIQTSAFYEVGYELKNTALTPEGLNVDLTDYVTSHDMNSIKSTVYENNNILALYSARVWDVFHGEDGVFDEIEKLQNRIDKPLITPQQLTNLNDRLINM